MGDWGDGPFENDAGLDEVFAVLDNLITKIEHIACGTSGDRSSLTRDEQELAANVELLCTIAIAVYRPALFVPIRGLPLPDPGVIQGWRQKFLTRARRQAKTEFEASPAERKQFVAQAIAPLDRLAELSLQQTEVAEATHQQVTAEVLEARKREAAGE
ncbi:MAG: hypothetical protein ACRCZF_21885 [Gemmataceae bacterium]